MQFWEYRELQFFEKTTYVVQYRVLVGQEHIDHFIQILTLIQSSVAFSGCIQSNAVEDGFSVESSDVYADVFQFDIEKGQIFKEVAVDGIGNELAVVVHEVDLFLYRETRAQ